MKEKTVPVVEKKICMHNEFFYHPRLHPFAKIRNYCHFNAI